MIPFLLTTTAYVDQTKTLKKRSSKNVSHSYFKKILTVLIFDYNCKTKQYFQIVFLLITIEKNTAQERFLFSDLDLIIVLIEIGQDSNEQHKFYDRSDKKLE